MNIGEIAKVSGINARLVRHYESIGLIPKASRKDSGYRVYTDTDANVLKFIKSARGLGFSLGEIKQLISLWRNKNRSSEQVKSLAKNHLKRLESKIQELESMASTLRHLAKCCQGDKRPECPILDELEKG
ncbi:Cu(I)-responsive transcriptional regulator [Leptospira idonii]|uniref:Cu(I)-responsive transcriptional regulator n=1 Tax=Leptospira idonii TaxID=1193500 RepID=A0A4R9M0Y2_9LEPT|nr:Cu(I)-responsive transcriptional regulator [Leptospira idonii]TGN19601.1 Cu(I)-responsive transcriptional regulator [Leptospira idonii]